MLSTDNNGMQPLGNDSATVVFVFKGNLGLDQLVILLNSMCNRTLVSGRNQGSLPDRRAAAIVELS